MKISVIGLGKLGLPIAEVFAEYHEVIGIDTGPQAFIPHKNITFTNNYDDLGIISFVVVPTPSMGDDRFTSEYVEKALEKITQKHIVVIVSTLMPGETDRLQRKYPHLNLVYNPTFVALGSVKNDFKYPDFILVGTNNQYVPTILDQIYSDCGITPKNGYAVMTPLEAEIAKLSLNCYITTKITFANQIGNLCHNIGIKPDKILEAIGRDSRIGHKYFKAGLGYGGPCFPRDNLALSVFMRDNNIVPRLMETVHTLNEDMVETILLRIFESQAKSVGFKSLSYKEGTDNTDCSQLKIIHDRLKTMGYDVRIGETGDINLNWGGIIG